MEIWKSIKIFFSQYSMEFILFIAGSLGAMLADNRSDVELTRKQKYLGMFFGGVTAVFSTQLTVELLQAFTKIELSSTASAGVGFYLGHLGLQGITKLMIKYSNNENK